MATQLDRDRAVPRPPWKNRVYNPAARRAGLASVRPYDLRHAFVSLLLAEGRSVVDVAAQAGHAPTMTLDTYAHVMADLTAPTTAPPTPRSSPPVHPWYAFRARVRKKEVSDDHPKREDPHFPGFPEKPSLGIEPRTPSLP